MSEKTAIITGFKNFGLYSINPTEILANSLNKKIVVNHEIISEVFPTSILTPDGATTHNMGWIETAIKMKLGAIISFGMASDVKGIRIESAGINWIENIKYCAEHENRRAIDISKPQKEIKRIDLSHWNYMKIIKGFRDANIPIETGISENAGGFCCNALIYRTLQLMERHKTKIPFIFLHVPCTEEAIKNYSDFDRSGKVFITQEMLEKTVEIMLNSYKK